jgi:hypothetical protein
LPVFVQSLVVEAAADTDQALPRDSIIRWQAKQAADG